MTTDKTTPPACFLDCVGGWIRWNASEYPCSSAGDPTQCPRAHRRREARLQEQHRRAAEANLEVNQF